jgi:hypothetical protein
VIPVLLCNAKLLTVWELACGDTEAVLCLANGDELTLVDLDPVAGVVISALVEAGIRVVDRPGDRPDVLRVRTYHYG